MIYPKDFKFLGSKNSLQSARLVLKELLEIIKIPNSLMDLGCGVGGWSLPFKDLGVKTIILVDHPNNKKENLLFFENDFYAIDLEKELPPAVKVELIICLEVLEHVSYSRSQLLIEYLTQCSDTILFSAAIPGQGGIDHINEKFSFFWEELFAKFHYLKYDVIRPKIIWNTEIQYFIRQNIFLYTKNKTLFTEKGNSINQKFIPDDFELVNRCVLTRPYSPKEILRLLPISLFNSFKIRLSLFLKKVTPGFKRNYVK